LASLEKSRILLVDDEEMMRKLIMDFLKTMDLEIIEAENGKEAISILDRIIPHLILLDIRMPEMHGFQLLDYVRNNPKTRSIPVIMMTVDDDIKTREEAFRKGANGFITKPVAMEELFPMVGRFFSGRV
jgi:CheY-like chemotaxis protein